MIKPGEDLRAELEALSERMARLEAMAESPDRARDSSPILDEEQFWALTGLQSQLNDHPSTVEGAVMLVGSLKPDLHTFSDLRGRACGLRRRGSWARLGVVGRPE